MFLRKSSGDPRTLMIIGMSALLVGSIGRWFLDPATPAGNDIADAIYGFLMGIAITANLLSVSRSRGECERPSG